MVLKRSGLSIFALMNKNAKNSFFLISLFLALLTLSGCHHKGPYNPYLDLKVKPSQEISRENNETAKKANKAYKRQMRKNRKTVFGKKRAPK